MKSNITKGNINQRMYIITPPTNALIEINIAKTDAHNFITNAIKCITDPIATPKKELALRFILLVGTILNIDPVLKACSENLRKDLVLFQTTFEPSS